MKLFTRMRTSLLLAGTTLLITSTTQASDLFELSKKGLDFTKQPTIQASLSSTYISFNIQGKAHGGNISIVGPNGYAQTREFGGSSETISLLDSASLAATNNRLPPGRYEYRIATHVGPLKLITDTMDNGRGENNFTYAGEPVIHSGSFIVTGGAIKQFDQIQEPETFQW